MKENTPSHPENKYDDPDFFAQYTQMSRSVKGLEGAGEWHILKKMLPDLNGKDVLDLGCGFGWHCKYAMEQGANSVIGIDISEKMLETARKINALKGIEYIRKPIEEVDYPAEQFDLVLSSLTFHYLDSFEAICKNVHKWLKPNGWFVFSVEHPVFTASGTQEWAYTDTGEKAHWPVDRYFSQGKREAVFLGEKMTKYHRTLTTYLNDLLKQSFRLRAIIEPQPSPEMREEDVAMQEELRRPMMLLISASKE